MKMVLPVDGYRSAADFMAAIQGSKGDTYWLMKPAQHWHGGIHLYDSFASSAIYKPDCHGLKCMTDGQVVAWRLNDDYQTAAFGEKMLKFSSTFVLIKSTCIPDKDKTDNSLDFYTLWMQIAPLSEYNMSDNPIAVVTASALKVRQDHTFSGWKRCGLAEGENASPEDLHYFEVPLDTHTTLPRGAVVEIEQEASFLLNGRRAPFMFVKVVSVPEGKKSGISTGETGWISGLDKFVKRQGNVLPMWMQEARKQGVFNNVVIAPTGNSAITIRAGEVIGHLSLYEHPYVGSQHFCHLEVFSQDVRMEDFLANKSGVMSGRAELHTLSGKTRWLHHEQENAFVQAWTDGHPSLSSAERFTAERDCSCQEADGKTWYYIPGEQAWMAATDVEKVNQFELGRRGFIALTQEDAPESIFQTPKESWLRQVFGRLEELTRSDTQDSYSSNNTQGYQKLIEQMDTNGDGIIGANELWRYLHNSEPSIQYQVQRLVIKHHSEWLKDGISALWQAALDEQAKKYPELALYNRDFINKLVWMKDVAEIRSDEALWHMHPVVFLDAIGVRRGRITLTMLREIWTNITYVSDEVLQQVADELNANLDVCFLNTEQRLYHFMAQVFQETGAKFSISESLNYASSVLPVYFSYYRRHPDEQEEDGRTASHPANQQNIAKKAYGGRNGNTTFGDGWRYRGRGMKQLTGRNNYQQFTNYSISKWGEAIDFVKEPDLVAESIKYAVRSALFFWDANEMYLQADKGYSLENSLEVTNIINKGLPLTDKIVRYNNLEYFLERGIFQKVFD